MADTIKKEILTIKLTYEMSVNVDTGEVLETRLINRSVDNSDLRITKPSVKKQASIDNDKEPKLILEDNKYRLNKSATELMNLSEDSRLNIRYEQGKNGDIPVIGTDEAFGIKGGNKISKSNTVAYRGNKNEELSKLGREFTLIAHPSKQGLFILSSGKEDVKLIGDDNIIIEDGDEDIPFDLRLDDVINDEDANIKEIDSNFFKL